MTGAELNTLINEKCGTNDTTFPQARKLRLVNIFLKEIASKIVARNSGYFLIPATFDLVANQREYSFPDGLVDRMHKLELKFSSTSARFPSIYMKDYLGSETESEIVNQFGNEEGQFRHTIRRRAVFILSGTIPNVTGGGRLWYHQYPADLANLVGTTDLSIDPSTTTFGLPTDFHELLARRVAIEWKGSRPKPMALNATEKNYQIDLKAALDDIAHPDNSGEIIANSLSDAETGNNGWHY